MPQSDSVSYLLSHRPFVRFWAARVSGSAANQMLMVAVAWQMYDLTHRAWDLGLVGLAQFVPALLMTLPAGQIVDRFHRGKIFSACMALQTVIVCVLLFATYVGSVSRELILVMSVMLGVARAFQLPAQQAIIPQLVPMALLSKAIALSSSGLQVATIGGPAIGGLLYIWGAEAVYSLGAVLLLLASALTVGLQYQRSDSSPAKGWSAMFSGLAFVWARKVVLGAISIDLFAVLLGGATALLPIYAKDILNVGPFGLGLLRAAPAVGALFMSLALARRSINRQVGKLLLLAVGVFGFSILIFGISTNAYLSFVALVISGAADNVSVVIRQTLVQLETPDDMRGRVGAVNSLFVGASNQLGEFESGATAALIGPVASVILGGVGTMLVAAVWFKLFPDLAAREKLHHP